MGDLWVALAGTLWWAFCGESTLAKQRKTKSGNDYDPKTGMFVYTMKLLDDERLRMCSKAAKWTWLEACLRMSQEETYMMPGDLMKAARMHGIARDDRAKWVRDIKPYIAELEEENVFTRGRDWDDSMVRNHHPDAIVSRFLYREWAKRNHHVVAGRRGGFQKAENERLRKEAAEKALREILAKASEGAGESLAEGLAEGVLQDGAYTGDTQPEGYRASGEVGDENLPFNTNQAKTTQPTSRSPSSHIQPKSKAQGGGSGGNPAQVGQVLGALGPLTVTDTPRSGVEDFIAAIGVATGGSTFATDLWRQHIGAILAVPGGKTKLDDAIAEVERDGNPRAAADSTTGTMRNPGAVMNTRLMGIRRELGLL